MKAEWMVSPTRPQVWPLKIFLGVIIKKKVGVIINRASLEAWTMGVCDSKCKCVLSQSAWLVSQYGFDHLGFSGFSVMYSPLEKM